MEIAIIYMVAGISRRFGGKAKGLAKIGPNDETLIEYSLDQAIQAGFTKIILIVSEKTKPLFQNHLGDSYKNIPIKYVIQEIDFEKRDKPWGTTDALCAAKEIIDSNFVICNGDDIYGEEAFSLLTNHLNGKNTCATLGYKLKSVIPNEGEVNRGIYEIEDSEVKSIKETYEISKSNFQEKNITEESLCSMNIFALTIESLDKLDKKLKIFKEENTGNREIECLLPEELGKLIKEREITMEIYPTNAKWFGLTNPEDELKVKSELMSL